MHLQINGKQLAKKRLVQKNKGKGKMKTKQKKEYKAPKIKVTQLKQQAHLMQMSKSPISQGELG